MRPPSEPAINKNDPNEWFIYFNIDVPPPLWDKYKRKRIRIKKTDNINRYKGEEREKYAELRRKVWKYMLDILKFNPFEDDLANLGEIAERTVKAKAEIKKIEAITEEEQLSLTPIDKAFVKFIDSRKERNIDPRSVVTYQNTVNWLSDYFKEVGILDGPVSNIKHLHISNALKAAAKAKSWSNTTVNKEIEFAMTIFNWLANEEFILKNPSNNRIAKLPTQKSMHRWYDKDTAKLVKDAIIKAEKTPLLRACQFTYYLLIRSKTELRKLKIGDIDRQLKRIRYSAELSKTNVENYRDYPPEFDKILDEMNLDAYPKNFYVFGPKGMPATVQCGHNYFSLLFKSIKDKLGLDDDYTIYGWKHTRIVHEMMKGTDGYAISHMARHSSSKSTDDYKRDYDITLNKTYAPEDLTF